MISSRLRKVAARPTFEAGRRQVSAGISVGVPGLFSCPADLVDAPLLSGKSAIDLILGIRERSFRVLMISREAGRRRLTTLFGVTMMTVRLHCSYRPGISLEPALDRRFAILAPGNIGDLLEEYSPCPVLIIKSM